MASIRQQIGLEVPADKAWAALRAVARRIVCSQVC